MRPKFAKLISLSKICIFLNFSIRNFFGLLALKNMTKFYLQKKILDFWSITFHLVLKKWTKISILCWTNKFSNKKRFPKKQFLSILDSSKKYPALTGTQNSTTKFPPYTLCYITPACRHANVYRKKPLRYFFA